MKVAATIGIEQWEGERRGNQKSDFNVWIVKNNEQDPSTPRTIRPSLVTQTAYLLPACSLPAGRLTGPSWTWRSVWTGELDSLNCV